MSDIVERLNDSLSAGYSELRKEAAAEITRLRAKIKAMEQREPDAWRTFDGEGGYDYRSYEDNENHQLGWNARNPKHAGWVEPLYLAPGAQPAPTALAGARKVTRDFRWDGATQCHVPMIIVEFEPVPAGSPNDAKGWQDRDRFAALTSGAKGE